jgi:hypothetical protein
MSDVFLFGIILYELVVGKPGFPFELTAKGAALRVAVRDE